MCGLVFTTTPRDPRSAPWRAAISVIECRGPDSQGEVHSDRLSAGHSRLEIIGLGDAGRQPFSPDPERELLLFNGEIYNYRELAHSMGVEATSDTQVLFHLLSTGQHARLSELRGMFAFVYWRADPELVITGRDLFGIKPLYVASMADGGICFASTPAALTPLVDDRSVDSSAVAGFLATGYFPAGSSPYRSIAKCAEGEIVTWRRGASGWSATRAALSIAEWPLLPVEEALADSVDAHLVADVPVGVLLSGGVDSTLVAAHAARRVDGLRTFSLVNPHSPGIDEAAYARWNAQQIGSVHTEVPFDPQDSLETIRELLASSGEPFGDAAYVPLARLCAVVAQDVKVVLAGEGADELFGGYRRYEIERMRRGRLTGLPLRGAARIVNGRGRYAKSPPTPRVRSWAHWGEKDDYVAYSYLLSAEWRTMRRVLPEATTAALTAYEHAWFNPSPTARTLGFRAHRAFDLSQWLPNVFLEKSDRASMLSSLEVRVPYLDPIVARSAAAVEWKDSRKAPLRQALLDLLPNVQLPPTKLGLSVDLRQLLSTSGLQEYTDFAIFDGGSVLSEIGIQDRETLIERSALNPTFAFRLGVLGLWQSTVLDPSGTSEVR